MVSDHRAAWIGYATLYAALTVAYAWPLLGSLTTALPNDVGDPGLNAWILWWNTQAVPLTARWWDAPIFFPVRGTFALSETLLALTPLTTPLQWAGASAVTAYNIAFLVSYPATALAAHALARRLTGRHDAALVAGLAFGFNPYRVSQIPHLQMLWAMWMPLCLWSLHRYLDTRRTSALVVAGVVWVLNGLTCGYYLVYFAVLAALWMLWFARSRREWIAIGGTLVVASLLLAPVLFGYQRHQQALALSRDPGEIELFSADLSGFWAAQENVWLPSHWTFKPRAEGELYPGVVILLLTVVGALVTWHRAHVPGRRRIQRVLVILGLAVAAAAIASWNGGWRTSVLGIPISLTRPGKTLFTAMCILALAAVIDPRSRQAWRRRSPLVFYAGAAVVMVIFALGPTGHAFGTKFLYQAPYSWLMMMPGGHSLRVPARFAMLCALCLSIAAAVGVSRLRRTRTPVPMLAIVGVAILADGWIPNFSVAPVSPVTLSIPLQERGLPLLELPLTDLFSDTAAMLRATGHGQRLVNGFSGYSPAHYDTLQQALNARDPSALAAIQQSGPMLVAIDRVRDREDAYAKFVEAVPGARQVSRSSLGPLFRLPGIEPRPVPAGADELPIAYVDASNYLHVEAMLDRDLRTIWQTDGPQEQGDQVVVMFSRPVSVSRLELDLGNSRFDYPRLVALDVADEGRAPVRLWEGRTAGAAVLGAIADPRRMPVVVPAGGRGRRFTLTILDGDSTLNWSIAELHAYGRQE